MNQATYLRNAARNRNAIRPGRLQNVIIVFAFVAFTAVILVGGRFLSHIGNQPATAPATSALCTPDWLRHPDDAWGGCPGPVVTP